MRVIAGELRGRRIAPPPGRSTRPTSDRVREAMFARLTAYLGSDWSDVRVLDPFAGSGALGIEALSRGAAATVFMERDPAAFATLEANLSELGLSDRAVALRGDARKLLTSRDFREAFSLILLDPPYRIDKSEVRTAIVALANAGSLVGGAHVVWEHDSREPSDWPPCVTALGDRAYGSTVVDMARYDDEEGS